nr:hypothetical protein [Tanacetum cinerariifolium]
YDRRYDRPSKYPDDPDMPELEDIVYSDDEEDVGKVRKETVSAQQYVLLPLWSTGSQDLQNTDDDVVDIAFDVKENENDVHVSANGSDKIDNKKHDEKAKRDDKRKSKRPLRATTPVKPTDPQRTEAEQLKIVLKRSRQETHISQQSG